MVNSLVLKTLEYVVVDVETTGLYPEAGDEIIEIGAVILKAGILQKTFQTLVNPERLIPQSSTAICGIKNEDVADAPKMKDVIFGFHQFVGNRILLAQNAKFDMGFILKNYKRYSIPMKQNIIIDTIAISKILFPYEQKHNLDAIMSRLGIARTGNRHRSLDDVKYTALIFKEFLDLLEKQGMTTLPDLEDAFLKIESIVKTEKPKSMSLFR